LDLPVLGLELWFDGEAAEFDVEPGPRLRAGSAARVVFAMTDARLRALLAPLPAVRRPALRRVAAMLPWRGPGAARASQAC
jgi:hypothetical protein